ncbi:MAG: virulence factor SrfC family protein [Thermoguttaceae bacterium]
MAFPDERDRALIRHAERLEDLATNLSDWLAEFNPSRRAVDLLPIPESDEFEVLQLRRLAGNLLTSARVPVAAAVYGPSQVGKSLFMGQVLRPHNDAYSPLGRDEQYGPPAYFKDLSFDNDLNPQSGSNEATALVTRFTTKDRIAASVAPEYPVMVRALTRTEWLRVLARGFHVECQIGNRCWDQGRLESLFEEYGSLHASREVDRKWRMDLLDAFSYMRTVDPRGFPAKEAVVSGLLSRYSLTEEGYVATAAALFWDKWPSLTNLFIRINNFLTRIASGPHGPAILTHWAGVRFLLDSQRARFHERRTSKCFRRVDWRQFQLDERDGCYVLDYRPDRTDGNEDLETIQAAMLELVLPVLPHRLNDDWRKVIEQMDFLDIPGMRAGRQGVEQGKRTAAESIDEQMEIVKRGKVAYLFERYTEELQIQTLFLLSRGGNLEVTSQMKYHIDKWGRARYGDKTWPHKVRDEIPALFIGMTGIDEEFRNREEYAEKGLYQQRLGQLVDALGGVMNDFGGRGKPFTNVYPIRYPGTWDTNQAQREREDLEKWNRARKAFLESEMVRTYLRSSEQRWDTAMRDDDGGLSLISAGIRAVTTADDKQSQLQREILDIENRLLQLSRTWVVNPDANVDREKRIRVAQRVVAWLMEREDLIYYRVHALRESLSVHEGDELPLADCMEIVSRRHGDPLPRQLRAFVHDWATVSVPKRWDQFATTHEEGGPWLGPDEVNALARYLADYLLSDGLFDQLSKRLEPVVTLKTRDEAARRRARRKYVRIIMNDWLMNPGASMAPIAPPQPSADDQPPNGDKDDHFERFGLMAAFVKRWARRLPQVLALGAGEHVQIPPGNVELMTILEPYEK